MPRRLIRALAYHRPGPRRKDPSLPTRTMWVDPVPEGIAALAGHPVFQLAPVRDALRAEMLAPERQQRILRQGRLIEGGPPDVLIWQPIGWHDRGDYFLSQTDEGFYDPYRPQDHVNQFRWVHHWVCMTRDRVWAIGGGDRDHMALGAYIHLLERLDFLGFPLPPEPQGPIPAEDDEALGDLAP